MVLENDCKSIFYRLINKVHQEVQKGAEEVVVNSLDSLDKLNEIKNAAKVRVEDLPDFNRLKSEENGLWALKWRMSIRKLNSGTK